MPARIALIGGGSTHWAPTLLVDFANTPCLQDARVVLMDLHEASLPPMLDLAKHITTTRNIGMSVHTTTSLADALDGAQFVVTAFSVGGFQSMRHDLEIPARYGVRQPVGDSVGPGGIARSLRSIPVIVEIARQMEHHCPDAWLVNVSNPLTALCRAVTKLTTIRTVGLCNELVGLQFMMSLLFDADLHRVDPIVGGVNHLPLVTGLRIGDDDGFALLRDVIEHPETLAGQPLWMTPPEAAHFQKLDPSRDWTKADILANLRVKIELFRHFGVLPGSADTHVAEFFPWFVTPASDYGREWGIHHYGLSGHRQDKADDDAAAAALLANDEVWPWPSGELVAVLLEGLVTGEPHELPVNLPNSGQVADLPLDVVVECMGVADRAGVRPRDMTAVPSLLGEYLRRVVVSQELTVDAALEGNRTTVLEAMLSDPFAGHLPFEHTVAMTDELLGACAAWLPQFS